MNNVLLIWTACNPSTIEKNHLILNGLEKNGIKTGVFICQFEFGKKPSNDDDTPWPYKEYEVVKLSNDILEKYMR